jgi:hypothetical protein
MEPFKKVIDDFYENPDEIRKHALKQKYQKFTSSYYAGSDSIDRSILTDECKTKLQNVFDVPVKFTQARYRYARSKDYSIGYIHSDINGDHGGKGYHALIYLTPDKYKTHEDSISLYEHKTMGKIPGHDFDATVFGRDHFDVTKFNKYDTIEHKYNRAIILDYDYFHAPHGINGFGDDIESSRLLHIIEIVPSHTVDTL